jgi:hypothetical protein
MAYVYVRISKEAADAVDQYRKELDTPRVSRNAAVETLVRQQLRNLGIDPNPPTEEE